MTEATDPGSIHPIAKAALACLKKDARGTLNLDVAGRQRITRALQASADLRQMKAAAKELICLAWFLEHKRKAPAVARSLLEIAETAADALIAAGESVFVADEDVQRRAQQYQRMLGRDEAHVAPHVDDRDQDPEGAVKAGFLKVTRGRVS